MPAAKQRGLPVIYVAGSARELPAEVQDWLGRAENRAVASPHIYDLLAQVVRGKQFSAVIVNIPSVDWAEMEFFDHVARLNRHMPVYVTGLHQQRAKLEAACRRGARLFDPLALEEDATQAVRPVGGRAEATVGVGLPEKPVVADEPPIVAEPTVSVAEPALPLEPSAAGPPAAVEAAADASEVPTPTAESRPAFRLAPVEGDAERPVFFPWSPNPNRPKRIPPGVLASAPPTPPTPNPPPAPPAEAADAASVLKSVKLTPEEVAALMADPPGRNPASGAQP